MKKKIILSIVALISLISIIISYKYSNNSLLDTSNMVAVYIDDKESDRIPSKDSGYVLDRYECSDETKIKWNYDSWSLVLRDFKKGTKCTYYFKKGKPVIVDNKTDEGKDKEEKIDEEQIGVAEGKRVGDLEKPTKEGYTFEGWYDENGNPLTDDMIVPLDSKLTAKWTINTYQLTIKTNGGTINGSTDNLVINLKYKEQYNIKSATKKGYSFDKFIVDNNKTTINNNIVTMGSQNTEISANWNINTYKLTVNTNCNNNVITKNIKYNESVTLEEPKCEGYSYAGFDISSGKYENNKFTISDSDATLSYKWTANKYPYIVRHYKQNVDGQNYTLVSSDTKEDQAVYNTVITPETKNYTGFTSPAKKSITIKVDDKSYKHNKVDYNYARNKYTLTINSNGGSYSGNKTNTLYYEQTATINTPTKACYTFVNWTPSSGTITDNVFKMGASNATLTANYQIIKYTITLNVNGGNALNSNVINQNCGEIIGTLPTPVRSDYTFDGWYTDATGGQLITSNVSFDRNTTIFAHWKSNKYTIKYDINDGSGILVPYNELTQRKISKTDSSYENMPDQVVQTNTQITLNKNKYYKDGENYQVYEFAGWAETPIGNVKYSDEQSVNNLTSPGNTKVLYAKFKLVQERYKNDQQEIHQEVNKIECSVIPKSDEIETNNHTFTFERRNAIQEQNIDIILNPQECYDSNMTNCQYTNAATIKVDWNSNKYYKYNENQNYVQIECIGKP